MSQWRTRPAVGHAGGNAAPNATGDAASSARGDAASRATGDATSRATGEPTSSATDDAVVHTRPKAAHAPSSAAGGAPALAPNVGAAPGPSAPGAAPLDGSATAVATGIALVPRGGRFEGEVALVGETIIEGTVVGALRGTGELILGPEARIEGAVECDRLTSRGWIAGPVVARTRVQLSDGARLDGDLEAPSIEIEGDALWNGTARVGSIG